MIAAVRQQMCNMVDAANFVAGFNIPPNMSIQQSMTPPIGGGGGSSSSNIPNPKVGSPAMSGQANKNGGEPSNIMQMPRLGSPAQLHNLPTELSMHGLQNLASSNDDNFRKRNRMQDDFMDEHQKALNSSRLSITKLGSPHSSHSNKSPSAEALEPAVNLAISGQSLDMSFKSSRASSDGSINGEDMSPFRRSSSGGGGFKETSPIKLEPLTDCRE